MNNWDKTKYRHTRAISAHPKGYISILNANQNLTQNTDNLLLGGVGELKQDYSCLKNQGVRKQKP